MSLTLIGTALAGCSDAPDLVRDVYSNADDCLSEWGDSSLCEESYGDSDAMPMAGFYGPPYEPGHRPDYVQGFGKSIATQPVESGGFGSTAKTQEIAGG